MATKPKILAFAGSTRKDSFNKKLVKVAAEGAKEAGAEVTFIDLKDYPMPIYDQDWFDEHGFPESVLQLKALMKDHQGFLIASPEYNSSITGVLKNAIDWVSRSEAGEAPLALTCFRDKVAVIMSTSPGGLGGLRGLVHLRDILQNIGTIVLPAQKAVPNAYQAFDDMGNLTDEKQQSAVQDLGNTLASFLIRLQGLV
jgi:NAD(P)H-dependent FMN reductase